MLVFLCKRRCEAWVTYTLTQNTVELVPALGVLFFRGLGGDGGGGRVGVAPQVTMVDPCWWVLQKSVPAQIRQLLFYHY